MKCFRSVRTPCEPVCLRQCRHRNVMRRFVPLFFELAEFQVEHLNHIPQLSLALLEARHLGVAGIL